MEVGESALLKNIFFFFFKYSDVAVPMCNRETIVHLRQ